MIGPSAVEVEAGSMVIGPGLIDQLAALVGVDPRKAPSAFADALRTARPVPVAPLPVPVAPLPLSAAEERREAIEAGRWPSPELLEACQLCREPWAAHRRAATGRVEGGLGDGEPFPTDREIDDMVEPVDCVAVLLDARRGPPGPPGAMGATGDRGAQGERGPRGPAGGGGGWSGPLP